MQESLNKTVLFALDFESSLCFARKSSFFLVQSIKCKQALNSVLIPLWKIILNSTTFTDWKFQKNFGEFIHVIFVLIIFRNVNKAWKKLIWTKNAKIFNRRNFLTTNKIFDKVKNFTSEIVFVLAFFSVFSQLCGWKLSKTKIKIYSNNWSYYEKIFELFFPKRKGLRSQANLNESLDESLDESLNPA